MDNGTTAIFATGENWKSRGIGLFHFLCFIVLLVALAIGVSLAVYFAIHGHLPPMPGHGHAPTAHAPRSLGELLRPELIQCVAALAATLIMALATGQRFTKFGYGGSNRLRNFLIGIVAGIALLAILLGGLQALGVAALGNPVIVPSSLAYYAVLYGALFVAVAVFEETAMRGYALVELSRAFSFWPAAIVLAALFGAAHLNNGVSEGVVGATAAGLFGLVLAYSFKATGSLWLALGIHAGWDYGESYIFGVPDSGMPALPGSLFHPAFHGPEWLTGGTIGPEGSVLVLIPLLLIPALSWMLRRRAT